MPDSYSHQISGPPARITILNVDDNEANRYAVTRMLKREGFAILEADSGLDAMKQIANRPDLVILDVNLPDIDGFEVCRRIKGNPATASIPVLHMSASYILSEDKTRGLDGGADGYLIRPVEPPELIATIRALLRIRSAEKKARRSALRWQATFDAIGDGVCLLDREGKVSRCNRAAGLILNVDPTVAVGQPLVELVTLPEIGEDLALGDRWFRVGIDAILDEDGVEVGSVRTLTEVTDRRRLEDELRNRAEVLATDDRRKDEFPGHARSRAAQPAGDDPQRSGSDQGRRRLGPRRRPPDRRAAGSPPGPTRRRPARRLEDHQRQDSSPPRAG